MKGPLALHVTAPAILLAATLSGASGGPSPASESPLSKEILLVPIGPVDPALLTHLQGELHTAFEKRVTIDEGLPLPAYGFNTERKQYIAPALLTVLHQRSACHAYEKVLAIIDHDMYAPGHTYVFGQAGKRVSVVSLTRLRPSFYGARDDPEVLARRLTVAAVHELGHTWGLSHCKNQKCVMWFADTEKELDRSTTTFCPACAKRLERARK